MKKLLFTLLILGVMITNLHATDTKIVDMTAITAPASTDIMYLTAAPGTTPVDRKLTLGNLFGLYFDFTSAARGDLLSYNASSKFARVAAGAQYSILVMGASDPTFLASSANVNTLLGSATYAAFRASLGLGAGNTASIPGTCTAGDTYYDSQASIHYLCTATNTWASDYSVCAAGSGTCGVTFTNNTVAVALTGDAFGFYNHVPYFVLNSGSPTQVLYASLLGTNVLTALGVNVGSAGAVVVNGGALGTDATMTTPKITTGIKDANGGNILKFNTVSSPTDYIAISNSKAGGSDLHTPKLAAYASSGDINFNIDAQGAGLLTLGGTSTGGVTIGTSLNVSAAGVVTGAVSYSTTQPASTMGDYVLLRGYGTNGKGVEIRANGAEPSNTYYLDLDPATEPTAGQMPVIGTVTSHAAPVVWTTSTGTGAPVRGTGPSITPQPTACSANCSPTAPALSNGLINNYGQTVTATSTVTGPAPVAGMNFIAILGTALTSGSFVYTSTGANIYLDTSGTAVTSLTSAASSAVGSSFACFSFQTGSSAYSLKCTTLSGTFTGS